MTEKQVFLKTWEQEFQTNLEVLNAIPSNKLDVRPTTQSHSAKELAWAIVAEERELIGGGAIGYIDLKNTSKAPTSLQEIITSYKRVHNEVVEKVKELSDADFDKHIKGFSPPKRTGDVRRADVFWTGLIDSVHNRGQLSAHLNMIGATVPSSTYASIQVEA
ncbi:MAG TPA: DinB family protein [Bacteroidota bacterium]|nr:DinB family protein [Bacteroidota bacterium]